MKLEDIVKEAIEKSSLESALTHACVIEHHRALTQARENNFENYDTCFQTVITAVMKAWNEKKLKSYKNILLESCGVVEKIGVFEHATCGKEYRKNTIYYCKYCEIKNLKRKIRNEKSYVA